MEDLLLSWRDQKFWNWEKALLPVDLELLIELIEGVDGAQFAQHIVQMVSLRIPTHVVVGDSVQVFEFRAGNAVAEILRGINNETWGKEEVLEDLKALKQAWGEA